MASLEEELRTSSRHEARARALQTECGGLRYEIGLLRRQNQELREVSAMTADEARARRLEAAAGNFQLKTQLEDLKSANARLLVQLEETRRARSLEMHALISKMSTPARSSAAANPGVPLGS